MPEFFCGRSLQERNALVVRNLSLVEWTLRQIPNVRRRARGGIADLMQAGMIGLIKAADVYDPYLRTPFRSFAIDHIRWAMANHLRKRKPLPIEDIDIERAYRAAGPDVVCER